MTKKKKAKPTANDLVPIDNLPDPHPDLYEVTVFTHGYSDPVHGWFYEGDLRINDTQVLIKWADGGFTLIPMDSVDRIHWEHTVIH